MIDYTEADEEFLADFRSMSTYGATDGGGVDRQAATVEDGQTREWFRRLLERHGFRVEYDAVGNQFGLLRLTSGAPYVLAGSHLDSQPLGGKYDGAFGVLAAAHAGVRLAERWRHDGHTPQYNYAVVNWFNEEGSRFKPSMMGSSVFNGELPLATALQTIDSDGVSVRAALDSISAQGDFEGLRTAAFAEIHIEQGRTMEDNGLSIGLVEATWGARKYELVVHGEQAHTGATMIADRMDALLGASMLVVAAREVADEFSSPEVPVVTSVGEMRIYPNSPVVVPRQVNLLLDIRCADPELLMEADANLRRRMEEVEKKANVKVEQRTSHNWPAKSYGTAGLRLAEGVATRLGYRYRRLRTVAGHDSTNMKDMVPTVMLFVPSVDGISHNEREYTKDEDMVAGVHMLTEVVGQMCEGALDNEENIEREGRGNARLELREEE